MKHRMRTIMLLLLTMLLLCPIQVLAAGGENAVKTDLEDGEYSIQVELEGGSGKARRFFPLHDAGKGWEDVMHGSSGAAPTMII